MKKALGLVLLVVVCSTEIASAQGPLGRLAWRMQANRTPWNGSYYDPAWGQPHALVVPPTAELQTKYSWGVTNTEVQPIYPKFRRAYPGPYGGGGGGISPMPVQPWHTDQFGVYYIRAVVIAQWGWL